LRPLPDWYICTGPHAKTLFLKTSRLISGDKVKSGYIIKNVSILSKAVKIPRKHVLVALDGFESTAVFLDWIFDAALTNKGIEFVIRFHPNTVPERILGQCQKVMPSNVRLSSENLQDDLSGSLCVLYRHSSLSVQALINGIPAVYVDVDSPLNGDPLSDFPVPKFAVHNANGLRVVLESLEKPGQFGVRAYELARDYFKAPPEDISVNFAECMGSY
jgi:hypothetical protein